jgi:hypothetical protein
MSNYKTPAYWQANVKGIPKFKYQNKIGVLFGP